MHHVGSCVLKREVKKWIQAETFFSSVTDFFGSSRSSTWHSCHSITADFESWIPASSQCAPVMVPLHSLWNKTRSYSFFSCLLPVLHFYKVNHYRYDLSAPPNTHTHRTRCHFFFFFFLTNKAAWWLLAETQCAFFGGIPFHLVGENSSWNETHHRCNLFSCEVTQLCVCVCVCA